MEARGNGTFALPDTWAGQGVFTMTDPTSDDGGPVTRIVVVSLGAKDLATAVAAVPPPAELDDLTVLYAQFREGEGLRFFERVVRFADPTTDAPVQQSVRIVAIGGESYALLFSTAAYRFRDAYPTFSDFARTFVRRAAGKP